jgi:DNA-binding transcriptional LysR family regulator
MRSSDWLTRSRLKALALRRFVVDAAEAVKLTKPAATNALGQIEEALAVKLFFTTRLRSGG